MDIFFILIMVIWCLWLSFKVLNLEQQLKNMSQHNPSDELLKNNTPPYVPVVTQNETTSAENQPSWIATMWHSLTQHIPKYQTSTWMALVLLGIGGISMYQYAIDQGWYHPSPWGGYLVTLALSSALLWKDRLNPVHYMTASVIAVSGFAAVSHQFNTVQDIGLWAHLGVIGFLLYYPPESKHYGYIGLGLIGTIISLFFHFPPISSMMAFALWVYHFKKPFNTSLFTFFEILMGLSFAFFAGNDVSTLYLTTMIASLALLMSSIHLSHWKEGLYYVLGMLSVFAATIMSVSQPLITTMQAIEWCFALLIPLVVFIIRSHNRPLARHTGIVYLLILTSFILLNWMGTPLALMLQMTGLSCLIAAIWSPIKPVIALGWMGYALFHLSQVFHPTLSWLDIASLQFIIASCFFVAWLPKEIQLFSLFTIAGHPRDKEHYHVWYALISASIVFALHYFWGLSYALIVALLMYGYQRTMSHSLVVFILASLALWLPEYLPWILIAALAWIYYRYHEGYTIYLPDMISIWGGYAFLFTMYTTSAHIAFAALIIMYVLFYQRGTVVDFILGIAFSLLFIYHIDTILIQDVMKSWGWSLWTLLFLYRLRYVLSQGQWNAWMWLLLGKMIVLDYAFIGSSYQALYALECLSLGAILFIMKKKLN